MHTGMKLGPFEIENEIGSGAMGTVYLARYNSKKVAIKVIAPGIGTNEKALERFEREAAILKQLGHKNIVRLMATGRYKKAPFYAMEFVEGQSLDKVMERRGRIPWEEVVELGKQLCAALQHAHEQGIVHRDLKPSNLMLMPDGTLKLTDFGIAKDLDATGLTATNCTVGTASYMSPEQCKGARDISHKSDLYSMGVVFFELLTARKPFDAESAMEMFLKHVKEPAPRPSRYVADLPVWLDTLVVQLLEKKPEDRPLDAATVAETLNQIQEKVRSHQSAALERAKQRRIDLLPTQERLSDEDKEAARALLRKKKKKKKKPPFYQRGWFVGTAVLLLLVGLCWFFYYVFFTAPSLQSIHAQAAELMAQKNFKGWRAAQDGPLQAFLIYYKEDTSPLSDDLRRWIDEAACGVCEHQMYSRRNMGFSPDDKGERQARAALNFEDEGKLKKAAEAWMSLQEQMKDEDSEKRVWGLVADKNLDRLAKMQDWMFGLHEKVAKDTDDKFKGDSEAEQLAVKALRAELNKDIKAAQAYWDELKALMKSDTEQRHWYLLAAYRIRELQAAAEAGTDTKDGGKMKEESKN